MTPISAVIITFNEEQNIGRCLDSLKPVADDIVVVDSFSTDRTKEICEEKGARFVTHKFDGHIEQKNWAITQAKYPHVLSLDADEALDEELTKSIIKAKESFSADGYKVKRLTNYCGSWIRHGNWYPDIKLRLWDSRKGKWTGLNPHDRYELEKGSSEKLLDGHLLHYSFYSFDQHLKQIHKFTDISSKAAFKKGKKSNWLKLFINPFAKFVGGYLLRLGLLDGKAGFKIAWYSAYATYLKYSKLLKIQRGA
ncbi:glycosyltransferase family 2 protein [Salibacter sp.]|uniref:glycosyltransferase family 2 protein n=1 Tax=Salibacter sp. TaxID=2010995 RepID=UPI00286FFFF7|nr:glycosyltransferase family 2 protein [Salibacter sp.]MDR9487376.1 glycosyltransferase family 2 protein [Salibacter sp.]